MEKFPQPENNEVPETRQKELPGFIKKALVGVAALSFGHKAAAQEQVHTENKETHSSVQKDTAKEIHAENTAHFHSADSMPTPEYIRSLYNKDADKNFESVFDLADELGAGSFVEFNGVEDGKPASFHARIKKHNPDGTIVKEEFTSLRDFHDKYPAQAQKFESDFAHLYDQHVMDAGWTVLLEKQKETLSNTFEDYAPSQEELDIIKKTADIHNAGGSSDGFDDLQHFFKEKYKTPQDEYMFNKKINGNITSLAYHLLRTYRDKLIKN